MLIWRMVRFLSYVGIIKSLKEEVKLLFFFVHFHNNNNNNTHSGVA